MSNQDLEHQILSLDLAERIHILPLLAQSLTEHHAGKLPLPLVINEWFSIAIALRLLNAIAS